MIGTDDMIGMDDIIGIDGRLEAFEEASVTRRDGNEFSPCTTSSPSSTSSVVKKYRIDTTPSEENFCALETRHNTFSINLYNQIGRLSIQTNRHISQFLL
jgi:hypothetical protein